jgi:molecular chaperone HscB
MNYFKLLDIKQCFNIDLELLEQKYLSIISIHHPDKAQNDIEKRKNLIMSADINNAYYTLKDDCKRAQYLLILLGVISSFEDASNVEIDPKYLEEIWNDQEKIDNISLLQDLESMLLEKNIELESLIAELTHAFDTQNTQEALINTCKLQYFQHIIINLKTKIRKCR